ncbi:GNAT family N-acetyltransferase [Paenibacillus puldeungensis]|uniref:GNAT family N-acetyltransferase n=1 Tax=Paenibacillus puldeungensis TaxID=696536 RepID=A0ABW3RU64_9BACL
MSDVLDTLETSTGQFSISLARQEDLEQVRNMLVEAAMWMQTNGVKQWNPAQFTPELIQSYFDERDIYLLNTKCELTAMFTLQDSDPDYWGPLNAPGYSYLHRLTVRVPFRRAGLGGDIIRWAAKRSRVLQRSGIRLDCWNQNLKLNKMYQELGFQKQGVGQKDGREYNLYELERNLFLQA